jgi:hypothetical protein
MSVGSIWIMKVLIPPPIREEKVKVERKTYVSVGDFK